MKRSKELDFLKGFAIFLMVFDHVGWGNATHTYIQSFHMPLFYIASGYLWKSGRSIKEIAIKRGKTTLIPYGVFAAGYLTLKCGSVYAGMPEQSIHLAVKAVLLFPTDMINMPFAPALWFLPCFWLCNVLYAWLDSKLENKKWIPISIIAITGMVYSSVSSYMLPFAAEPLAVALLFMLIGEIIRTYEAKIFPQFKKWWAVILLLGIEAVLVFINGSVDMRSARYHNCFLYIINAILGTLVWWVIARKCVRFLPSSISSWLVYLSINSIAYLCMNQFFIKLCKFGINRFSVTGLIPIIASKTVVMIITLLLCTLVCEVINKTKLKGIFGR